MKFARIIKDTLIVTIIIIIAIPLIILISPIVFISLINTHFTNKAYKKAYQEYLLKINGCNFFCYNNKRSIQNLIEQKILPLLDNEINIIFLDGRKPVSDFNNSYISTALYEVKNKIGFPYLLKIRDGVVIDKSINAELYKTINHNKDMNSLVEKIDLFFKD
ncbi:hypothetical protein FA048_08355 [Pedobacter polaris]|uniref:Uncharacterized protein n=1 Tax=Pedobacter polaris TaxID=2571273 RepID=A0A4U1CVI1_9SPHI|nr:hypothetical protein [Pedobacter polaris]TKC10199.1 hypothetical protein FA048_08355 [Pedobacter polaris]